MQLPFLTPERALIFRITHIVAESGVLEEPVELVPAETEHHGQLYELAAGNLLPAVGFESQREAAMAEPAAGLFVIGFRKSQSLGEPLALTGCHGPRGAAGP